MAIPNRFWLKIMPGAMAPVSTAIKNLNRLRITFHKSHRMPLDPPSGIAQDAHDYKAASQNRD
jgi:hypothetical protein